MSIKRYVATADNTITNAYVSNLRTRGTGSNMGASDILEVFHIFGQESSSSSENARILIQFPTNKIATDRTGGIIPASGSVNFFLRLYNAKHSQTLPQNFNLLVTAVKSHWEEGNGLDMEEFSDLTYDITGSNWANRAVSTAWTKAGGDFIKDVSSSFSASFTTGVEDMELNITTLVEQWVNSAGNVLGSKSNYGVGVYLSDANEVASGSYYTKKFFARGTEFFFKRPVIEARWDSTVKDNRGNFYFSSSLAPGADNLNTLYMYNIINGQRKNIPAIGGGKARARILVSLYSGSAGNTAPIGRPLKLSIGGDVVASGHLNATGGYASFAGTGSYSASIAFTGSTSLTKVFDVWHYGGVEYFTGSITANTVAAASTNKVPTHITSLNNLKSSYSRSEKEVRFNLYTRERDWQPTIYTVASTSIANKIIEDAYYKIFRIIDNKLIIPYATGSTAPQAVGTNTTYTRLSYDDDGNYFDLDISLLEAGYSYAIQLMYYDNNSFREQPEIFKFRVEE